MKKILVVDDEPSIRDLLELILEREQYTVVTAADGKDALRLIQSFLPDIVILDLMLPDISGHDLCREISNNYKIPVLMLTAKNDVFDKVIGLELGADDYVTKPFDERELLARIRVLLRRFGKIETGTDMIRHLDLEVNLNNKTVYKCQKLVELSAKEFQVLALLAKNPHKVFERQELLERVWGYDFMGDSRVVDICITRLRKKISDSSSDPVHIITVHGFGYRFGGE